MSEKKFQKKDKPEELLLAKQLIDKCKLDEADQLIRNFEEKGGHTLHYIVLCHLLKCELLYWQGLYEDVVKLAEQTYKKSLGLGPNLLSVDILIIMAYALDWLGQNDKAQDIVKQGEELLKTINLEKVNNKPRKSQGRQLLFFAICFFIFALIILIPLFYINRTLYVLTLCVLFICLYALLYSVNIYLLH